jgi:hypothetical protein
VLHVVVGRRLERTQVPLGPRRVVRQREAGDVPPLAARPAGLVGVGKFVVPGLQLAGVGVRVVRKLVADAFDCPIDTSDDGLDLTPLDVTVVLDRVTCQCGLNPVISMRVPGRPSGVST